MDKWVIRKRQHPETGQEQASQEEPPTRNENEKFGFLHYGFTCHVKDNIDYPLCVLCNELLATSRLNSQIAVIECAAIYRF